MSKPKLTAEQKKLFETKFRELVKHEKAKESILLWGVANKFRVLDYM